MITEKSIEREMVAAFGANVRARRLDLNLSQAELAERIAASVQYVSEIELSKRTPLFRNIAKFAHALRCKPAFLFRPAKKFAQTS